MKELALKWWSGLSHDQKYDYFCEWCNRFTRNLDSIKEEEIIEIYETEIEVISDEKNR